MTCPSRQAAVATARDNLARLEERRIAALEGGGKPPDPRVIEAARAALRAAEFWAEEERLE